MIIIQRRNDHSMVAAVCDRDPRSIHRDLSRIAQLTRRGNGGCIWNKAERLAVECPARSCIVDQAVDERRQRFRGELARVSAHDVTRGIDRDESRPCRHCVRSPRSKLSVVYNGMDRIESQ